MKLLDVLAHGIKNLKSQKKNIPVERKSYTEYSFSEYLFGQGQSDLSAWTAIMYYKQVAAVYTAVTLISLAVKSINPVVINKKDGTHVEDFPIMKLTSLPNADVTWDEFIEQVCTFYTVTGNAYIIASGPPNKPAFELYSQPPQNVIPEYQTDGFVREYRVSNPSFSLCFKRKEINGRFRFYTDDGMQEIWHIRTFNPANQFYGGIGMSPLLPVSYDIQQQISGSEHNLSLLNNGARLGTVISPTEELSDEQYTRIRSEIKNYNTGPRNAGRTFFAPEPISIAEMGVTNKDMDFLNLKKESAEAIYNALGVPLPLISSDTMTYANYEAANVWFYNRTVIPTAKKIYLELNNFLMHRYPGYEQYNFTFDPKDIVALDPVVTRTLKDKQSLGIYSPNELRAMSGLDPYKDGDLLYMQNNMYPIGDVNENEKPSAQLEGETLEDEDMEASKSRLRSKYTNILRMKKDENGDAMFNEQEISEIMNANGM